MMPPSNVRAVACPNHGHEVRLSWIPVDQPRCVLTIREEIEDCDLPQAVKNRQIDILQQVLKVIRSNYYFENLKFEVVVFLIKNHDPVKIYPVKC